MTDLVLEELKDLPAATLVTLLRWDESHRELQRVWTSDPGRYPVGGTKTFEPPPRWLDECVHGRPFHGPTQNDIREAFYDHELIISAGCGSFAAIPVMNDARMAAVVSVLGPEGAIDKKALAQAQQLVQRDQAELLSYLQEA